MLSQRDNPFSRYWKKEADLAWSRAVKQAGRCAYCGSRRNLQAHHLISRRNYRTRHKIQCGICLCKYHHLYCPEISPHLSPREFKKWLRKNLPSKYRWIQRNEYPWPQSGIDYKAVYVKLARRKAVICTIAAPRQTNTC